MVCVTQQITCERLILKASDLKNQLNGELFVIHVAKNEWNFLDNVKEGEALEYLFKISKSVGANLSVLKSDNIVESLVNFAKENKITHIVMGESPKHHEKNAFYTEISNSLPDVEILVIP
jgi:K+-sensing histidine kinase KdpD